MSGLPPFSGVVAMQQPEDEKTRPAADRAGSRPFHPNTNHTAWPARPRLSDAAERVLAQKPAGRRPGTTRLGTTVPSRIGDVEVTGELTIRVPQNAMAWEIRRTFSIIANLPDGVTVIVKLPRRHRADLTDALGGLDNLPNVKIVVKGSANEFARVAEAVAALRLSAARRAAELRAVAS